MGAPCSLALELKFWAFSSSVSPHRKAIKHPTCFPSFCLKTVFTLPMFEPFYIRCVIEFSKLPISGTPAAGTHTVPLGEGLAILAGQSQERAT